MYKLKLVSILVVAFCFSQRVQAQQGPVIECFNCEGLEGRPYPTNGNWYNPEQSGSGYILEVQHGLLSGFYFGYNDSGNPIWVNFSGFLQEGTDPGVIWTFNSELASFTGGNAVNQPYSPPELIMTGDSITIDFYFKNYAKVKVNDGETQNLIPLTFGVDLVNSLPETDFLFPDLEGMWTLTYNSNENEAEQFNYTSDSFWISNPIMPNNGDGSVSVEYYIEYNQPPFESYFVGFIVCSTPNDGGDNDMEVTCVLTGFPTPGNEMVIPIGDLGAFEFSAQNQEGGILTGKRVNFLDLPFLD